MHAPTHAQTHSHSHTPHRHVHTHTHTHKHTDTHTNTLFGKARATERAALVWSTRGERHSKKPGGRWPTLRRERTCGRRPMQPQGAYSANERTPITPVGSTCSHTAQYANGEQRHQKGRTRAERGETEARSSTDVQRKSERAEAVRTPNHGQRGEKGGGYRKALQRESACVLSMRSRSTQVGRRPEQ